jgi:ribulose kinase
MNSKGHAITSIYMSGGQAKNMPMMQLLADACDLSVVLPHSHANAVVLGAAMLGRFAADVQESGGGGIAREAQGEALWRIMVRDCGFLSVAELLIPGCCRWR